MTPHEEHLVELFHTARIAQTFGMRLRFEDEAAVFEMPYDPRFDHGYGDVHGGVIATLIDNAGFFAAAARHDTWIVTVEFQVRLLEPARRETLRAQGRVVRRGARLTTTEMQVHAASGRLVAVGSGSFVPTRQPLPEAL